MSVLPKLHAAKKAVAPCQTTHQDQINAEKVFKILQREETIKNLYLGNVNEKSLTADKQFISATWKSLPQGLESNQHSKVFANPSARGSALGLLFRRSTK